jgi:hypothetical protein
MADQDINRYECLHAVGHGGECQICRKNKEALAGLRAALTNRKPTAPTDNNNNRAEVEAALRRADEEPAWYIVTEGKSRCVASSEHDEIACDTEFESAADVDRIVQADADRRTLAAALRAEREEVGRLRKALATLATKPLSPITARWGNDEHYHAIFLSDGTKITVGRDERTKGPAWLEVGKALIVTEAEMSSGQR